MEEHLHPMVPLPRESILSGSLEPNSGYPTVERPDIDLNNVKRDSGGLVRGRVKNSAKIGLRSFIRYRVANLSLGRTVVEA